MTKEQLSTALMEAGFAWHQAAASVCNAIRCDAPWSRVRELIEAEESAKNAVAALLIQVEGGTP